MKRRNMDTKVISASCLVAMAAVLVRLIYKMATDFRWFMTISTGMLILYIIGTMAIEIGLYYIVLAMKDIDDAREAMRSDINYNITQIKNRYNHLICLGQGELKDRQVLHLYIDKRGNITDTQAFKGFEERTAVYDYSSATDMDELKSGGIARLQELNADRLDMTLPDMAMQIGDITGGTEKFTGATVKKQITNIIAKIDDNSIDIEYSVS